jgi:hypothetical protein
MRLGLFISILVALLAIVGLTVPITAGLPPLPPGLPDLPTQPQCLALEGDQPPLQDWVPPRVRLLPHRAPGYLHEGPTYEVIVDPDSLRPAFTFAVWQPVGADSLDIALYHSSVLRIPVRGSTRVGRLTSRGYTSFFAALLMPDRLIRVEELPCPPDTDAEQGAR